MSLGLDEPLRATLLPGSTQRKKWKTIAIYSCVFLMMAFRARIDYLTGRAADRWWLALALVAAVSCLIVVASELLPESLAQILARPHISLAPEKPARKLL